jgi:pimeloyl-ACP methyl ester carboxylesterase
MQKRGSGMKSRVLTFLALLALASGLIATGIAVKSAHAAGVTKYKGSIGGAAYVIEVPTQWNGTLVLYSHGYVRPGAPNPAMDAGDPATEAFLLNEGYALAGSSYSATGWAIQQALHDQIALLDAFPAITGLPSPTRTIAWGHSLGGIITAGLVQLNPDRFAGALPMCGVLSGGVGTWNVALDGAFALKVLLAGNQPLQLVHITNPGANLGLAEQILGAAQSTPQGRARLALSAALADLPGWFDPASSEPAATDFAAQEQNQYLWETQIDGPFEFALRAELEFRAGGNPSWNTGVNYTKQLENSVDLTEVDALYQQAGLSLSDDLAALGQAQRIAADPGAVSYVSQNIIFNGQIGVPVLTMHTTGDGLVINENEQAYSSVVRPEGNNALLREIFVHRAGHCAFTPAETITAFQTLVERLDTGQWRSSTDPALLNQEAAALGSQLNVAPPAFLDFQPAVFLRPFDARDLG